MNEFIDEGIENFRTRQLQYDYDLLKVRFQKDICTKCIRDNKQNERNCCRLSGSSGLGCMKMEDWIHIKQKKEKKEIMQNMITDLKPVTFASTEIQQFYE